MAGPLAVLKLIEFEIKLVVGFVQAFVVSPVVFTIRSIRKETLHARRSRIIYCVAISSST